MNYTHASSGLARLEDYSSRSRDLYGMSCPHVWLVGKSLNPYLPVVEYPRRVEWVV